MATNHKTHLIGVGIYSVPEAARLTDIPAARIRRWLNGYSYPTSAGCRQSDPVIGKELESIDGELALSFLDLMEVRIIDWLRRRHISWKLIRLAEKHATDMFKSSHPFATRRITTDGYGVFTDLRQQYGERPLIDLTANQFAFRKFIESQLKDIEFDQKQQAIRWWPMGQRGRILLDPQRGFGQPIVKQGVPTAILAQAMAREKSAEAVAQWYEVSIREVRDAVDFERKIAA